MRVRLLFLLAFAERLGRPCTRLAAFRGHAGRADCRTKGALRATRHRHEELSARRADAVGWSNRRVAPREGKPPADTPEKHEGH